MAAVAERIAADCGAGPGRAAALLAETVRTAEACVVDPVADLGLGTPHFPEPTVVGAEAGEGGAMRLLKQRRDAGMTARGLDSDRRSVEQLEYELGIIGRLGYEPYFLAVAQVVADTRDMGIRVAARGSGAGSMVNHALFIATANPLEHHLLFERFLSERRASLPDIDIDVESARRLEVYDRDLRAVRCRAGRGHRDAGDLPGPARAALPCQVLHAELRGGSSGLRLDGTRVGEPMTRQDIDGKAVSAGGTRTGTEAGRIGPPPYLSRLLDHVVGCLIGTACGRGYALACLPPARWAAGLRVRMRRSSAVCLSTACGPLPVSSRTDGS